VKRIRWFGADWQVSLRTLAVRMRASAFTNDSLDGFIVDKVRDDTVGGRYIEKVSFQETLTDPFGDQHSVERTIYRQLEFNLFTTFPNVEFWDAPRSTSGYVSKVLELSDFAITLSPLSVDLIKWAGAFQSTVGTKVTIDSIQISGLEIERGVTARIVIAGDKDVREALKLVVKNKNYVLEKLQLRLPQDGAPAFIKLASTGSAKIEESHVENFASALRRSLPKPRAA
jgi:hypothetical protein